MALPDAEHAIVDPRKIHDYLLSDTHPVGRHKARLFSAMGFAPSRPQELEQALVHIACHGAVTAEIAFRFGVRYIVDGAVRTPTGAVAMLRTVWVVAPPAGRPHFVTAYPLRRAHEENHEGA